MEENRGPSLNGYHIEGYSNDHIIFSKNGEYISIKSILPKKDLILRLGIQSVNITRKFKDSILDEASKKGKWAPNFVG